MTINFTTAWARSIKSQEQYDRWLAELPPYSVDRVMVQEFVPRGKSCLDSQCEYWRFWPATYDKLRSMVRFYGDWHPFKNGGRIYFNSDSPHGDVFQTKIVPIHNSIKPAEGSRFFCGHAPVFEPDWDNADRCFALLDRRQPHGVRHRIRESFPRCYDREVNGGHLYTIFAYSDDVEAKCNEIGLKFLYSESTWS